MPTRQPLVRKGPGLWQAAKRLRADETWFKGTMRFCGENVDSSSEERKREVVLCNWSCYYSTGLGPFTMPDHHNWFQSRWPECLKQRQTDNGTRVSWRGGLYYCRQKNKTPHWISCLMQLEQTNQPPKCFILTIQEYHSESHHKGLLYIASSLPEESLKYKMQAVLLNCLTSCCLTTCFASLKSF